MADHKKDKLSALSNKAGVQQEEFVNKSLLQSIKLKRRERPSSETLISQIKKGSITALSQAITLVESSNIKHQKKANAVIQGCLPYTNQSIRIGITGVPGVGKSTFIEALGEHLTKIGKKVAVLAIDPSSSISKGSILGDKTRMEALVTNPLAYIRPSASGDTLGGVARKTRESIVLCEAAGFEIIIIETVGVGQSETAVHSMVDFFLLLKLAGAGDELQGIKRGIIEMADAIVINKADGNNMKAAKLAKVEFNRALHLYPKKPSSWQPKVLLASALKKQGIEAIWHLVEAYINTIKPNGYFKQNRIEQNKYWLIQTIDAKLKSNFYANEKMKEALKLALQQLEKGKVSPFSAAEDLLAIYK